jgi:HPt (histidine-containing phosphotransfer) domain-containing protein
VYRRARILEALIQVFYLRKNCIKILRYADLLRCQNNAGEVMSRGKTGRALDLDIALAHVDGDRQLLAELSSMFVQDYPRLLDAARHSIVQDDFSGLERAAHTLKGRLAFFGIHKAREQALELEMMARNNDLSRARQALDEIEAEMEGVLAELESLAREQSA